MSLDELENELKEASLSHKDWIKAAEIMLAVESDGSWRESGLRSLRAWIDSLTTRYGVSNSWLWRAQQAAKYLPQIWPHHHEEPAEDLRGILEQIERNISPSGVCALATLASRKLSDGFLRSVESAYFSGVMGVTDLWKVCTEIETAKERGVDPEIYLSLFRADFTVLFSKSVRLITNVEKNLGFDALFVLGDGTSEPEYAGLRLGPGNTSDIPRSLDCMIYLLSDAAPSDALDPRTGVILVDPATAQLEEARPWQKLDIIKTKKAALTLGVLNHLLTNGPVATSQPSASSSEG